MLIVIQNVQHNSCVTHYVRFFKVAFEIRRVLVKMCVTVNIMSGVSI